MMIREYAGLDVQLTDDGFLSDSSQWTPEIAEELAVESGIGPLTDEH